MKIKINDCVLDYENKPVKEGGKDLTWRMVFFSAMNSMSMNPNELMTNEDKSRCYQLTTKSYQTNEPNFTPTERTFILQQIRKFYSPLVCGRAEELLDKKEE